MALSNEQKAELSDLLGTTGETPPVSAKDLQPSVETLPPVEDPVVESVEESPLDEETLQALGLLEPGASTPDDSEDGAEEVSDEDLRALANRLGLEPTDFVLRKGKIALRTKVDGEENEVSLAELRKGYQLQSHFTRQQEQFLREQEQWNGWRQQAEQQFSQQAALAHEVLTGQEAEIKRQYTRDWETLRQDDPSEYAAQVADYNRKIAEVRQRKAALEQSFQQRMVEQQQQHAAYMQDVLSREQQRLDRAFGLTHETPPEARQKRYGQVFGYLTDTVGFQPQELQGIADHRAFVIADKARQYDELMARINTARKKVAQTTNVPADRKAGPPKASVLASRRLDDLEKKALSTNRPEDRRAVLREVIKQSAR